MLPSLRNAQVQNPPAPRPAGIPARAPGGGRGDFELVHFVLGKHLENMLNKYANIQKQRRGGIEFEHFRSHFQGCDEMVWPC